MVVQLTVLGGLSEIYWSIGSWELLWSHLVWLRSYFDVVLLFVITVFVVRPINLILRSGRLALKIYAKGRSALGNLKKATTSGFIFLLAGLGMIKIAEIISSQGVI